MTLNYLNKIVSRQNSPSFVEKCPATLPHVQGYRPMCSHIPQWQDILKVQKACDFLAAFGTKSSYWQSINVCVSCDGEHALALKLQVLRIHLPRHMGCPKCIGSNVTDISHDRLSGTRQVNMLAFNNTLQTPLIIMKRILNIISDSMKDITCCYMYSHQIQYKFLFSSVNSAPQNCHLLHHRLKKLK